MDAILLELARQLPSALAIGAVVFLFLRHDEHKETRRDENAKAAAIERRSHEVAQNQVWSNFIHSIIEKQDQTYKLISESLANHEENSAERYKRIGATQDLLKRARIETKTTR